MEASWAQVESQQKRLEELQRQIGPIDWDGEQADKIREIIGRLFSNVDKASSLEFQIQSAQEALERQQSELSYYLQQIEQEKGNLLQQQNEVDRQGKTIQTRKQELNSLVLSLENTKVQLKVQEQLLMTKQELLGRINLEIGSTEEIKKIITGSGDTQSKQQINIQALENMPLGELQEVVKKLQADFDKIVRFVNDQEEELSLMCETVDELQEKIRTCNDYDRFNLESELAEEQERQKFLNETLLGQRRTLRERQALLAQHLKVLRRRQGVMEIEDNLQQINLEPILLQLKERKRIAQQDRQRIEKELEQMQESIKELQETISRQESDRASINQEIQNLEENWLQATIRLAELQSRVRLSEEALMPLQQNLEASRQKVEEVAQLISDQ
jgi:chromosome segregation ATPase